MDFFAYGIFAALVLATGFALIALLLGPQKLHAATALGLSWTFGTGAVSTALMVISLMGHVPDRFALAVIGVVALTVIIAWRRALPRPQRPMMPAEQRCGVLGIILSTASMALIAVAISSVYFESRVPGLPDTDGYAIWVLKAKVVAALPLRPVPVLFSDPSLSFSHQDYPLAVPLLTAAVHAATGWEIAACAKALLVPNFLALVLVAYGSIRTIVSRPLALASTAAFVSGSVVISLAGTAEAELPLLLQHTASLCLLTMWLRQGRRGWLMAAGVAAAFAAMTKNEGLALMPILGVATIGFALMGVKKFDGCRVDPPVPPRSGALMEVCAACALTLLVALPWLIYRTQLPHTHEDYGGKLSHAAAAISHFDQLSLIAKTFLGEPLRIGSVGGFWLLLPIAAAIGWRAWRERPVLIIAFVLLAHTGLYLLVFLVTPWDVSTLLPMVSAKLMMHVSPAALLLIALFAEEAIGRFHSPQPTAKTPAMAEDVCD